MTNAVLFGSSGGIGSVKGFEDIFRVKGGCQVKKGDFLTYDYHTFDSGIESDGKKFISYQDEYHLPEGFIQRRFHIYVRESKEVVVKNACTAQEGVCEHHPIVAVALDNGGSLEVIRVKKVNHNFNVSPYGNLSALDYNKFQTLHSEAKAKKLFGTDLLNYINSGMGYN